MTASKTMDFFAHQEAARRASKRLTMLFAISVACIVAAVSGVALLAFGSMRDVSPFEIVAAAATLTIAVIAVGSMVRMAQLRSGGPAIARMLGGREVDPGTRDLDERRLINVVDEMAIASGIAAPRVFVLDGEDGINAFAAGFDTRDAAIAVTKGALLAFDRDELQGVIAHEFSHVFHGDMRLNTRLIGTLAGIVCLVTMGELLLRSMRHSRGRKNDGAAALAAIGLSLMVIGSLGAFFAGLIKSAVSRQREYLADASAVAYTRNPLGIGRALWRIASGTSRIEQAGAREASHMFFADGFTHWLGNLGATHPPIRQRIERIVPGFAKAQQQGRGFDALGATSPASAERTQPATAPYSRAMPEGVTAGFASTTSRVRTDDAVDQVGEVRAANVAAARSLLQSLPLDVASAAHDRQRVAALVLALALPEDSAAQTTMLTGADAATTHDARQLAAQLRPLHAGARLAIAEICAPALGSMDTAARDPLLRLLRAILLADGTLTPFEFALLHVVQRHAQAAPQRTPSRALNLGGVLSEIETVLSWMAHAGASEPEAAFARSRAALPGIPPLTLQPKGIASPALAEEAVARLGRLSPQGKRLLLRALAEVAAHDGSIGAEEGELLRALCACWECPMPPLWISGSDPQG